MQSNSMVYRRWGRRIWGVRGAGSVFKRPSTDDFYACDPLGRIVGVYDDWADAMKKAAEYTLEKAYGVED